ncbi:hypothetical protein PNO29_03475 [Streptococcus vestibularis]|uniref:hypothetical protein n=1 Tax=Streptococcus vestibularis TaxID=1343 RepID=UPI00232E3351|nr:hypothetical protein [Streptococcus vestibularis]MDB6183946.1 hypothetical protein [Streptococcus vestibularis]MDB6202074.1 hypothetical protein [Streptococcus vestibularis]MDB6207759.1 hypothetical protein [Streptococcus vestibularis]MDB6211874.1 hypothetical protein [Streptococcus vestibularis]MDB6214746.1 hypothetical protein [Streptococcus vestibularis]
MVRYITPAGEIGRSIFVYNPATKSWSYFDKEGNCVPGYQYIDGYLYYFKEDGSQSKGESIEKMALNITMSQNQVFSLTVATSK